MWVVDNQFGMFAFKTLQFFHQGIEFLSDMEGCASIVAVVCSSGSGAGGMEYLFSTGWIMSEGYIS